MKKIHIFACLMAPLMALAMDEEPRKPYLYDTPMLNPETGEGYLTGLPNELKSIIIMALTSANDLEDAIDTIRTQTLINTHFKELINQQWLMTQLIDLLFSKFGTSLASIAAQFNLSGAEEYLNRNMAFLIKCGSKTVSLKDVQEAVESKIDVNFDNIHQVSILHNIILSGVGQGQDIVAIVRYLIEHGALVDRRTKAAVGGTTILFCAVLTKNIELVTLILNHTKNPAMFNLQDSQFKLTPLQLALRNKLYDIAKLLIKFGAPLVLPDSQGVSLTNLRDYLIQTYGQNIFTVIPDVVSRAAKELTKKQ